MCGTGPRFGHRFVINDHKAVLIPRTWDMIQKNTANDVLVVNYVDSETVNITPGGLKELGLRDDKGNYLQGMTPAILVYNGYCKRKV